MPTNNSWNNEILAADVTLNGGSVAIGTDASSGAINIGTGAAARITTLGNISGNTAVNINTGTGGCAISTKNSDFSITTGTGAIRIGQDVGTGLKSILIGSSDPNATGTMQISGTNISLIPRSGGTIAIGIASANKTITIGSTANVNACNINAGSGGCTITTANSTIGLISGTGAINIGADAAAKTTTIGNISGTSTLALKTGSGGYSLASATGTIISASDTGYVTMPLQPAFLAYLGSNDNDISGDNTVFTIGSVTALTEIFDHHNDFNTNGTFTAPVTGIYLFQVTTHISGGTLISSGKLEIVTSNNTYRNDIPNGPGGVTNNVTGMNCTLADMDNGDTCIFTIATFDTGGKVDDIIGSASPYVTYLSGKLEC